MTSGWEYCVVAPAPSGPLLITVSFYGPQGGQVVQHRTKSYEDGVERLWPSVIAQLGQEGWELVMVEAGAWHFKRPLH